MKSPGKTIRWSKALLLGCALGLLFVFINLSVLNLMRSINLIGRNGVTLFQLSDEPVKRELTQVIGAQLAAFRKGDFAGAYDFAAEPFKARISPADFERMMKAGYPLIAHSRAVSFGMILDDGNRAVVTVGIRGESGRMVHYQYLLTHEPAGWRITGVTRITLRGTTV